MLRSPVEQNKVVGFDSEQVTKPCWVMEKKLETTIVYWGYIGVMEKKMETTIVYWGYIGVMENKMETTIVPKP